MQSNNWCFDSKFIMFFFPHELVVVVSTKVLVGSKNRHTPNNFTSGEEVAGTRTYDFQVRS